jgi:hypothetical protein
MQFLILKKLRGQAGDGRVVNDNISIAMERMSATL